MSFILSLTIDTLMKVWYTLLGNWPYLVVSALFAALLTVYMDLDRISTFLRRYRRAGVVAATAAAVGTPLCSCGTMAVILGMMAGMMPWAPIVAFLVSSPLTVQDCSAGLLHSPSSRRPSCLGWPAA